MGQLTMSNKERLSLKVEMREMREMLLVISKGPES
jgi:hypothetical protein